ncbi:hypothetical protein E2C01_052654 [Portunus trituberculatus]|uniref:Uncharacterized protein n=1 Tax=Portunus trituberculatus TaxID=210409 RepID=A0A5B7GN29_PORTR|nr:hypothetical protein [Portunus trituberculatus]
MTVGSQRDTDLRKPPRHPSLLLAASRHPRFVSVLIVVCGVSVCQLLASHLLSPSFSLTCVSSSRPSHSFSLLISSLTSLMCLPSPLASPPSASPSAPCPAPV